MRNRSVGPKPGWISLLIEGHFQQPGVSKFVRVWIGRYTKGEVVLRDIEPQGPVEPVLKCQPTGPIRIQFLGHKTVMNSVHARSHDDLAEPALRCEGQLDI
jgi:hypothetical protein